MKGGTRGWRGYPHPATTPPLSGRRGIGVFVCSWQGGFLHGNWATEFDRIHCVCAGWLSKRRGFGREREKLAIRRFDDQLHGRHCLACPAVRAASKSGCFSTRPDEPAVATNGAELSLRLENRKSDDQLTRQKPDRRPKLEIRQLDGQLPRQGARSEPEIGKSQV